MGLNGKYRVCLRAFEYGDLPFLNKIRNDPVLFSKTCGTKYFISSEWDKKWVEDKIFNNKYQLYLMICLSENLTPIGYICAINIDYINRKAQWGGIVIDTSYSRKGYGTESAHLLLNYLFCELGMHMICGHWREDHTASLKMAEKLGFRVDGTLRDYVYREGRYHNVKLLSILRSEYPV